MTTSLVAEVLKKSGRFAKEDVCAALDKLSRKIDEVKGEVNGIVQKQYKEYVAVYADTTELLGRVKGLTGEMQQLSDRMENELLHQVREATSEQRELSARLEKCEAILELLRLLCKIFDDLQAIDADIQCGQCVMAAKRLAQTESSVLVSLESGCDLPIFEAIRVSCSSLRKNECAAQRGSLVYQLEDMWSHCVSFTNLDSRPVQLVKRDVTVPKTEFKFSSASTEGSSSLPVFHIVQGLQALGSMDRLLKSFGTRLWQHILLPIIENPHIQPVVKVKQATTLVHFKPMKGETAITTNVPAVLFKKLLTVLKVVRDLLVDPATQSTNSGSTRKLGDQMWHDLSHSVVTHCLSNSIPKQSSELESYQEVITCVADFESQLIELGYVPDGTDALTQYAKDVNVHFANQKCQDLLVKARKILLTDIHNTLLIDDKKERGGLLLLDKPPDVDEEVVHERLAGFDEDTLKKTTFHFPSCHVSRNVKELVDLAYDTLIEATESNQCGVQLFFAVRDMFELFRAVVPSYHKKILDELPQMAAIHHNNCMYLAHHLSTLGHQFTNRLPWPINDGTATFVDMVSPLRKCGQDCYLAQLRKQRTAMLESLASAESFVGASSPTQSQSIERALKQVLQQLQYLNRIWQDILPTDVFLKSIGALLNSVLEEIIKSVLKLQDISATEAGYLHQLLSVTLDEAPLVFKPISEKEGLSQVFTVTQYAKHWPKFEKLLVILEASMQTIVDMWGDGKTSFARQFTVSEVRGLIRALFKNTDRRADALARIKLPAM